MKKLLGLVILLSIIPHLALAKIIYQQGNNQANYVKIVKVKENLADERAATHPVQIAEEQMKLFMASLRYNRAALIKSEVKEQSIFTKDEIDKFAPHLVQALAEADPFENVFFSIVTKRPYFIVRNDAVNQGYIWVHKNELHVQFTKLAAKLTGDYKAQGTGDRIISNSKGLRVSLEVIQGQKLSFEDGSEIIVDMNADWPSILAQVDQGQDVKKANVQDKGIFKKKVAKNDTGFAEPVSNQGGVEDRLKKLKSLKDQGLISPQDYDLKKKEILKNL